MYLRRLLNLLLAGMAAAQPVAAQHGINVFDTDVDAGQYYRIPAVAQLPDGTLLAIADDRHGSDVDIGGNSGIDIVSLANNHIMDYSGPALQDTLSALDAAGILHAGAGMTEADADWMVETTVNGASIAFFSWTNIVPENYVAYEDEPGVASARLNMDDALRRVREAKETHDIVIVAMHWGIEYTNDADDSLQITPAHQLVDAGADVILGNHPHTFQGIEFYNLTFAVKKGRLPSMSWANGLVSNIVFCSGTA